MINDLIQNFIQAMKNEGYNVEVVISKQKKEVPQVKVGDFVKAWDDPEFPVYGTVLQTEERNDKTTYIWLHNAVGYRNFEHSKNLSND
jgi:isocitrate lyase